eukprot:scaffold3780_cov126-Amphora_coffeaeformis.AAC.1
MTFHAFRVGIRRPLRRLLSVSAIADRVLIVPQTVEHGLILVLSWVFITSPGHETPLASGVSTN